MCVAILFTVGDWTHSLTHTQLIKHSQGLGLGERESLFLRTLNSTGTRQRMLFGSYFEGKKQIHLDVSLGRDGFDCCFIIVANVLARQLVMEVCTRDVSRLIFTSLSSFQLMYYWLPFNRMLKLATHCISLNAF